MCRHRLRGLNHLSVFLLIAAACAVLTVRSASAQTPDPLPSGPTFTGESGLFTILTADGLEQGEFNLGLFYDNSDRAPGDIDISTAALVFGIGLVDDLEVALHVPYTAVEADPYPSKGTGYWNGYYALTPGYEEGFGDVRLGLRYAFLTERNRPLGLGLAASVKFATADEKKGLGTGEMDYGATAFLSKKAGPVGIHVNLGYTKIGDPTNVDLADQARYGIGLEVPVTKPIRGVVEITGTSFQGGDIVQDDFLDLTVGAELHIKGFGVGGGIRYNFRADDDNSEHPLGGIGFVSYSRIKNHAPEVTLRSDKEEVPVGESVTLTADAFDRDGDELTYSWTATKGAVNGEGKQVTWDAKEEAWEGSVTFTVNVNDGRGGMGTDDLTIKVLPPRNRPPVLNLNFPKSVYQGETAALRAEATYPEGETVTYAWAPEAGSIAGSGDKVDWTAPKDRTGEVNVKVTASDPQGASTEKSAPILVKTLITFPTIQFGPGSRLDNIAKAHLDEVALILNSNLDLRVRLVGYTDDRCSEKNCLKLGRKRAQAVADYLAKTHGIDPARLVVESKGKADPVGDNKTEAGRKLNRRVEIHQIIDGQ
ncbi:MAG: OmpA family protein [Candidatus Schekmanbacteria bacterium]|nr:OmpA family protein [Candidatus Schekmanbacteria bacterium]